MDSSLLSIRAQIGRYVKALDVTGRLLTVVSLLPTLVSIAPGLTGLNISIPIWVQSIWFILAFGWANLRIFESQARTDIEIRLRQQAAHLKSGWLKSDGNRFSVESPLFITFIIRIDIYNHDPLPVDMKIFVHHVESNWNSDHQKRIKDQKIRVNRQAVSRDIAENNPLNIAGRGIADGVTITSEIPFNVPDDRKFAYLAELSNLCITLGFEQAGRKIVTRRIDCSVTSIKESIEHEIRTKVCHNQALVHHGLEVLKEFWRARN